MNTPTIILIVICLALSWATFCAACQMRTANRRKKPSKLSKLNGGLLK